MFVKRKKIGLQYHGLGIEHFIGHMITRVTQINGKKDAVLLGLKNGLKRGVECENGCRGWKWENE